MARQVGREGLAVLTDINREMLIRGRDRLIDRGLAAQVAFVIANAECLPFADASFDCVTIGFGLRNVTDKPAALASMRRVLRPGGRLLVLEFSKPRPEVRAAYDSYSFNVLPRLGGLVAGDAASYRYLAESIRMHPDQETLAAMIRDAGFDGCRWHNLAAGIVALHVGVVH
jgi:demethylmenaquinone methyltransferase/2-methoxy-6-polyprenyl-1,4-benzoquinol methylase